MKRGPLVAGLVGCLTLSALLAPSAANVSPAGAPVIERPAVSGRAVAVGSGGAVATVDPVATEAGLDILRAGGNAVDAAVAAAAVLGVTEPYSAGIGGGGFFVYYDAREHRVSAVDGRETAPARMRANAFVANGRPIPVNDAVTSGLSVGVPGTPATWHEALRRWGTVSLRQALGRAIQSAERGFVVDKVFRQQTADNVERFRRFTSTRSLFLPGGTLPQLGSVFRNPDLAATYRLLGGIGHNRTIWVLVRPARHLISGPGRSLVIEAVPEAVAAPGRASAPSHGQHPSGPSSTADTFVQTLPGSIGTWDSVPRPTRDNGSSHFSQTSVYKIPWNECS